MYAKLATGPAPLVDLALSSGGARCSAVFAPLVEGHSDHAGVPTHVALSALEQLAPPIYLTKFLFFEPDAARRHQARDVEVLRARTALLLEAFPVLAGRFVPGTAGTLVSMRRADGCGVPLRVFDSPVPLRALVHGGHGAQRTAYDVLSFQTLMPATPFHTAALAGRAPLGQMQLTRGPEGEAVWAFSVHHAVTDGSTSAAMVATLLGLAPFISSSRTALRALDSTAAVRVAAPGDVVAVGAGLQLQFEAREEHLLLLQTMVRARAVQCGEVAAWDRFATCERARPHRIAASAACPSSRASRSLRSKSLHSSEPPPRGHRAPGQPGPRPPARTTWSSHAASRTRPPPRLQWPTPNRGSRPTTPWWPFCGGR